MVRITTAAVCTCGHNNRYISTTVVSTSRTVSCYPAAHVADPLAEWCMAQQPKCTVHTVVEILYSTIVRHLGQFSPNHLLITLRICATKSVNYLGRPDLSQSENHARPRLTGVSPWGPCNTTVYSSRVVENKKAAGIFLTRTREPRSSARSHVGIDCTRKNPTMT